MEGTTEHAEYSGKREKLGPVLIFIIIFLHPKEGEITIKRGRSKSGPGAMKQAALPVPGSIYV
jgi:hypothetical protein